PRNTSLHPRKTHVLTPKHPATSSQYTCLDTQTSRNTSLRDLQAHVSMHHHSTTPQYGNDTTHHHHHHHHHHHDHDHDHTTPHHTTPHHTAPHRTAPHRTAPHRSAPHHPTCLQGIISDLFPGVVLPKADYAAMEAAMRDACAKRNLQPTEYFLLKVLSSSRGQECDKGGATQHGSAVL
ncbi:hypothetical protein, partial [Bosea sp. (in: a-proteobacteria)]|uniref:hypothetical protein n=1 Tax=Bosea sp. (in: a-proteobacteria) TaxID=1871050 RepID=UPI00403467E3